MKRANFRIFLILGLFAILAMGSVHAQSAREQTANIPFPVNASGTWYVYVVANRTLVHTPLDNFIYVGPLQQSSSINNPSERKQLWQRIVESFI